MIINCENKELNFAIDAPASKSIYHRELIIRFLCGDTSHLEPEKNDNEDVLATKACLSALFHAKREITRGDIILPCNESGSTLRFMIPVADAYLLSKENHYRLIFETKGRLFDRPIEELKETLSSHGVEIYRNETERSLEVTGHLTSGEYIIGGHVSSQYISGLLMALTLFEAPSSVMVMGEIKSVHYIELTQDVLAKYNAPAELVENIYLVTPGGYRTIPLAGLPEFHVEGDWSNGAFLLCLSLFTNIIVGNLNPESKQGDKAIGNFLSSVYEILDANEGRIPTKEVMNRYESLWNCTDIPDIAPYMAITSAFIYRKAIFTGIERLHIKESDRVKAARGLLSAIGIETLESENTLTVYGKPIEEIRADIQTPLALSSCHDHRMAMCAILIAAALRIRVEIDDVDCLRKSFPEFLSIIDRYMGD